MDMSTQPNMTEPLVIPVKPNVKPVPKRETPKPSPRRGDPWTVPGPKKKPTPKAAIINEMTKKNNNKMIIDKKSAFLFLKKKMTMTDFYDKFELAPSLVVSLTAETACAIIEKTDRILTAEELKKLEY